MKKETLTPEEMAAYDANIEALFRWEDKRNALIARIEKLERALKPLAAIIDNEVSDKWVADTAPVAVQASLLRVARDALK